MVFSRIQPNIRKYFPKIFLKCNQTHENIFFSGKQHFRKTSIFWKCFYTNQTQPQCRFFSALGAETHVLKKAGDQSGQSPKCVWFSPKRNFLTKCVWFSPKRNFLKKVAFWAKAENAQNIIELQRSIKQKFYARSELSVGLFLQLPNYPSHFTENLTLPFDLGQTIFLSNISKLKHNQMQTQKHNLKINQTTTIKAKKFLLS